jgi:hypothetical protein
MNSPDDVLGYLRYLRSRIDALTGAERLGVQEIGPFQGEVRAFRERVPSLNFATKELKEHLGSLRMEIAEVHLEGTKEYFRSTWWMYLPWLKLFRASRDQKNRDVIDSELSDLRSELYDLYCLVEVTFKEPSQPPN